VLAERGRVVNADLLHAVLANDVSKVRAALDAGASPDDRDSYGWSALSWAAGRGASELVEHLLAAKADVFAAGDDGRTPYLIAIAAGHVTTARLLAEAEKAAGGDRGYKSSESHTQRPYCRAYPARALEAFAGWNPNLTEHLRNDDEPVGTDEDPIVFLHRDLSVTRSAFHGEQVVFDEQSPAWGQFCSEVLEFRPPDDFGWLTGQPL
jgi:uncharacterized protein